jgi:hypothetical protein
MLLGDNRVLIQCTNCKELTTHRFHVSRCADRRDMTFFTCEVCKRSEGRILTHFLSGARTTACALPKDRTRRRFTTSCTKVSCPECVAMMVGEMALPVTIDWRPEQAIPEDAYAV